MSDVFWTGVFTVVLFILKEIADQWKAARTEHKIQQVRADVKENTEICRDVVPKVDSATRQIEDATKQAEKITETAAAKVGTLIGKVLGDKADRAAEKVAVAASQQNAAIANRVEQIAKVVKGDDGTCLTGRVEEHSKKIDDLNKRIDDIEADVQLIKGDTKQIIGLLSGRGTS